MMWKPFGIKWKELRYRVPQKYVHYANGIFLGQKNSFQECGWIIVFTVFRHKKLTVNLQELNGK